MGRWTVRPLPWFIAAVVAIGLLCATDSAQAAEFGISPGSLQVRALDSAGEPETRAGAHPDRLQVGFSLDGAETGTALKELTVDLPRGLAGDPLAVPRCPRTVFDTPFAGCPRESQIGIATTEISGQGKQELAIFNIEPTPGQLAVFGFNLLVLKVPLEMSLRQGDFGLTITERDMPRGFSLERMDLELWGVPADHQTETSIPRRPFLTTPTRCGEPLGVDLHVRSWQVGAPLLGASATTESPLSGCGALPFEPRIALGLAHSRADSPTGAQIDLLVPQEDDPDRLASAQVKSATVSLPAGMTVSPGAAADLQACSDAQFGLGTDEDPSCPAGSRVGGVELTGPALREPLEGDVYIGQEKPGERFRLLVVAEGMGVVAKFTGALRPDPVTGRLTAILPDLPQMAFSQLRLKFDDAPRPLLVTPLACGPATATGRFESHSESAPVVSTSTVTIASAQAGSDCPAEPPFAPEFTAGVSSIRAGAPTTFSSTLRRADGEQSPERFSVVFPLGLSARLGSVDPCEQAAASRGGCPAGTRIGSAVAEVGSGGSTAALPGAVFFTGPYRGAPFGLALAFDAKLGPFDLGSLVVRARLRVDPRNGQVSVETDALPQSIDGLPVRFRAIGLDIDRPGFMRNPTSCEPTEVRATAMSTGGVQRQLASPFALGKCNQLGFRPRLAMGLTGAAQLRLHDRPGLSIVFRSRPGDTNLSGARIPLPRMLAFDSSNLMAICSRHDAGKGSCPAASAVGSATARSPLLDEALTGSVYVVQPKGLGPPDLLTVIRGMGIRLDIRGKAQVEHGRFETRFVGLPDFPLSSFAMRLFGGKRGILSLRRSPCGEGAESRSQAILEGQDSAARIAETSVAHAACGHELGRVSSLQGREAGLG
jgi:hypothetical protein